MLPATFESIDGRRVRVARLGDGAPLVLLHGYPDSLQIWSNLAPLLAKRFRAIAFDWPGMGASEAWSGGATPYDLARRVVRLLDAWRIERATLVAHDMGGQAALACALVAPDRVASLVIMNCLAIPELATSWEIALLRRFRINRWLFRHAPRFVFRRAVRTSIASIAPELRDELWSHFAKRETRDFIVRMCAGYEGTLARLAASYRDIATPTQIIWAARDRHFPPAHARELHARIARSTLRIIDDADHWMALDRAAEVDEAIVA